VAFEALPHRRGRGTRRGRFVEVRLDAFGRRWRRRAENVLQNVLATNDHRGACRIAGDGEHAAVAQHTAALGCREIDAPELGSLDARDAVVASEPLVQVGVPPVEELQDAAVLTDEGLQEQLGLPAHREAQVVLEGREALAVGSDGLEGPELEPLAAEGLDESAGFRVTQHAPHLGGQDLGLVERALLFAPPDDEPDTDDDDGGLTEARQELARDEGISTEELERELGLR